MGSAPAATINFASFDFQFGSGNELLFVDDSGAPLTSGFLSLLGIHEGAPVPTDVLSLRVLASRYQQSEPVLIDSSTAPGGIGFVNAPLTVLNDGSWTGVPLYLVVGNGPNIESSTFFGFFDLKTSFTKDDTPPPDSQFYTARAEDVLIGEVATTTIDPGAGPTWPARALYLVPEPSSLSLLSLAFLLTNRRARPIEP